MDGVLVSPAALAEISDGLEAGRSALESCAGSVPGPVDGGLVTPLLAAMLARILGGAAVVSEGLAVLGRGVASSGADFWSLDASVSGVFAGGECRVDRD